MAVRSPGAWLELLERRLHERWNRWAVYDAYYEGDHQLAFATRKWREAFGAQFAQVTDNWMPLVVDSPAERLKVQGFRFGKQQEADQEAWDIWQANGLDAEAAMLHTESIKLGEAYWLVEPPREEGGMPKITAEHPSQMIVACAPGDRRTRLAALKKWVGEDGFAYATVYLPDSVEKFVSKESLDKGGATGGQVNWVRREGRGSNPLGVVPVVPMPNNPSLLRGGRSDLAGGPMDIQNAVNKLLSDMLIGSEFQAYPQRVLLGVEPPKYPANHPNAGEIIRGAELEAAMSRTWYFSKGKDEVDVKEFSAADLENFNKSIERLVGHLAAQTRTPPHYVLSQMVNISGDALKAAETGLTSKVRDKMDPFGEGHEETMRLAFRSQKEDDPRAEATDAETIWRDPESRSQAEIVDAAVKEASLGVPQEILWEKIGYSPQQIDRIRDMQEADSLLAQSREPLPTNGQVPPGQAQQAVAGTASAPKT